MKKIFNILLVVLLTSISLCENVFALPYVRYLDRTRNGTKIVEQYKSIEDNYRSVNDLSSNASVTLDSGKWVVYSNKEFKNRVKISGNVELIIDATLTCQNGIEVPKGSTLTIYGGNDRYSTLNANTPSGSEHAAIGSNSSSTGGKIIIKSGYISTYGNNGHGNAGIGGGKNATFESVEIYGGTIYASSLDCGPGIGNGASYTGSTSGEIFIYGGDITARAGNGAAGIGGGSNAYGVKTTIWGGNIIAEGADYVDTGFFSDDVYSGAGIGGGGNRGQARDVYIYGGTVIAKGGEKGGAGIGGGNNSSGAKVVIGNENNINCNVKAIGGSYAAGIGAGSGEKSNGGNVEFISGVLEAYAHRGIKNVGTAYAISGSDGGNNGKLSIPENAKVTYGDSLNGNKTIASKNQRIDMAHSKNYALINGCEHNDVEYTEIDAFEHHGACKHCLYEFDEKHTFEQGSTVCTKNCGFEGITISFYHGWHGKGTMPSVKVVPGEYELPDSDEFEGEDESYHFKQWSWIPSSEEGKESPEVKTGRPKDIINVSEDLDLVADFSKLEYYRVTIADDISGGVVSQTREDRLYYKGEEVKLTVTPAEGNSVDYIKYKDSDGHEKEITEIKYDDKYVFEMPDKDVVVSAGFSQHVHDWRFKGFTWTGNDTDGYTSVNADYVCSKDSSHTKQIKANLTENVVDPTCTTKGKTTYTASIDENTSLDKQAHSEEKIVEISALGHDWGDWSDWSTVGEEEVRTRTCKRCSETQTEKKNHVHKDHLITPPEAEVPATCTENGTRTHYECTCGYWFEIDDVQGKNPKNKSEFVIPAGHVWERVIENKKMPTCTEAGSHDEVDKCKRCPEYNEDSRVTIYDPAVGHDWNEWSMTNYPTALHEGERTRTCKNDSSHTETEKLDKVNFIIKIKEFKQESNAYGNKVSVTLKLYDPDGNILDSSSPYYDPSETYHTQVKFGEIGTDKQYGANFVDGSVSLTSGNTSGNLTGTAEGKLYNVRALLQHEYSINRYERLGVDYSSITMIEPELNLIPSGCPENDETTGLITVEGSQNQTIKYYNGEGVTDHARAAANASEASGTTITNLKTGTYYVFTTPGASSDGKTFYLRSYPAGGIADSVEVTGHEWGEALYDWSADYNTVTASRYCLKNKEHIETEEVRTSKTIIQPATSEVEGIIEYTGSFENKAFSEQKIRVIIPKLESPYINIEGDGNVWYRGSKKTSDFVFKNKEDDTDTYKNFSGIKVDGKFYSKNNSKVYSHKEGSVEIYLQPDFLEALSNGKHVLIALFEDDTMSAYASFTIKSHDNKRPAIPKTGIE